MKLKSTLAVLLCFSISHAFAQWTSSNPTSTSNKILINTVIAGATTPGSPPAPPVFRLMTTDNTFNPPQITYHLNVMDNGAIGFGTAQPMQKFHVNYTSYFADKVGVGISNPAEKLHVKDGNFLLSNSASQPVLRITSAGELTLNNTSQMSYLRYDLSGNLSVTKGDILVHDGTRTNIRLYQDGLIWAREVKVNFENIPPDYVFAPDYKLMPFDELRRYLDNNRHLPGVPSASEMQAEGTINVGVMQFILLEKVEELTLYMLQLQKENEQLKKRLCALEK